MRIAFCISGQPRNLEKAFPFIDQGLLRGYNADVFIHFWKGHTTIDPTDPNSEDMKVTLEDSVYEKALELYKPKRWLFEPQPDYACNQYFTETYGADWQQYGIEFPIDDLAVWANYKNVLFPVYGDRPHNMISQLSSWKYVNQLKKGYEQEHKFKYDCVVRIRPDFVTNNIIEFENYDLNNLYVVGGQHDCAHHASKGDDFAINDWFGFGSSEIMDTYASLIDDMPFYYYKDKIRCIVEVMLGWHMRQNQIPITKLDMNSMIIRGNG